LKVAWKYSSGYVVRDNPVQSTPVYTGTKLVSVSLESVYALNPDDGSLIWEVVPYDTTKIFHMPK
jgi:outer membrane protein assembly factor BamB